jgi:methyl-accepting chemotaxis protein
VAVSGEVNSLLTGILDTVTQMNVLVKDVASASQEQHRGVQQITQAVSQMDSVTQSNAANAEQSSAASQELGSQAASLSEIVRRLTALMHGAHGASNGRAHEAEPSSARTPVEPLLSLKGPGEPAAEGMSSGTAAGWQA